jgi:hypothetical protein
MAEVRSVLSPREFAIDRKAHLTGRLLPAKDIGRLGTHHWRCEAVTLMPERDYPKVMFVMRQRLERIDGEVFHAGGSEVGDAIYRFGYYTIARSGRWHFGQYALMIRVEELEPLLQLAREEGTILLA